MILELDNNHIQKLLEQDGYTVRFGLGSEIESVTKNNIVYRDYMLSTIIKDIIFSKLINVNQHSAKFK